MYLLDTVPWKPRLASRYSITSFEVIAGFCTAAVVLVMLVLIESSLSYLAPSKPVRVIQNARTYLVVPKGHPV